MVHTIQNLKTSNLNPGFEFQQLLVSLKHVINLVMRIRDMGCHTSVMSPHPYGLGATGGNHPGVGLSVPQPENHHNHICGLQSHCLITHSLSKLGSISAGLSWLPLTPK
jgi:hypothetical protein